MTLVADTSVILAVVLNEPTKPRLIQLTTGADLIAPLSLHWEIGNALFAMLKRKRITEAEAQDALLEYQKYQSASLMSHLMQRSRSLPNIASMRMMPILSSVRASSPVP